MKRLSAALCVASFLTGSSAAAQSIAEWKKSVEFDDWSLLHGDDNVVWLYRNPATNPNRVWIRVEMREAAGAGSIRGIATLYEVDCEGRRSRALQATSYASTNLKSPIVTDPRPSEWTFAVPGSNQDSVVNLLCSKTGK